MKSKGSSICVISTKLNSDTFTKSHRLGVADSPPSSPTSSFHFHALEKEMATHSSVLAWRAQEWGSLVSYHLWGHTESDMTEVT